MKAQAIAQYIGVPTRQIERFMGMTGQAITKDPEFISLLNSLDKERLEKTLPQVRDAYERGLPEFERHLRDRYGLENTPMSAFTLGNWVVGALQFPQYVNKILDMHSKVPTQVFVKELPVLLDMVNDVPHSKEWQRALCVLSLPLMRQ